MRIAPSRGGPGSPIHASRKILCIAIASGAAVGCLAPVSMALPPQSPSRLLRAELAQAGRRLILTVRTSRPVALAALDPPPRRGDDTPYLCVELSRPDRGGHRL